MAPAIPSSPEQAPIFSRNSEEALCHRPHTPPSSPNLPPSSQIVTFEHVRQFMDMIKLVQMTAAIPEASKPETTEDVQPEQPRARASKLEFKTVNEVWDKSNGYKIEEAANTNKVVDELDQYVFILRKKFDKSNMDFTSYLDIKSDPLRDVLRKVLKDVPGQSLSDDMLTFDPRLLFHYVLDLRCFSENQENGKSLLAVKHVDLLLEFMEDHYGLINRTLQSLLKQREISFDSLWVLYKPNDLIFTTCPGTGKPRCVRFISAEVKTSIYQGKYFNLECRYLNHDSKRFGEVTIDLEIPEFSGLQKIHTLAAFPLRFHKGEETVRSQLIECGRKFTSLQGIYHQRYHGQAFYMNKGVPVKSHVSSRVIVDEASFKKANPNYSIPKIKDYSNELIEFNLWGNTSAALQFKVEWTFSAQDIQQEDLLICSPTVLGYSLEDKTWFEFAVAELKDINWDLTPFERLELKPEKKRIIEALTKNSGLKQGRQFNDIVRGKGQGVVSVLHGPPGSGKTLTAEAVSETLRRPLYLVGAGELGANAVELEQSLEKIFHLAGHWNAVLLLDEADVFLEQRISGSHTNNSLVSVFLRRLEYFQGIMFLTTHRLKAFDEAILSRIHFPLKFLPLNKEARKNVWVNFLKMADAQNIDGKQVDSLAAKSLNGRQIRNMVRTGIALAEDEGVPLAFSHLNDAILATEEFEVDFKGHGSVESFSQYQ